MAQSEAGRRTSPSPSQLLRKTLIAVGVAAVAIELPPALVAAALAAGPPSLNVAQHRALARTIHRSNVDILCDIKSMEPDDASRHDCRHFLLQHDSDDRPPISALCFRMTLAARRAAT
ncbi:MAG: hypothetical protein K2Z80_33510 [Xanthobacteraceae bacterium]|nr:hypothetical protein [Xanthobacteraceae bacterium]